jgi:serine/threonine-protein kinase HipA
VSRSIGVFMGDAARPVGTLHYDQQGRRESAAFAYSADWLAAPDRFSLDPSLPLQEGRHFNPDGRSVFHASIADTDPDGWGRRVIRRDHLKRRVAARKAGEPFDDRPLNSLDYLLAADDFSRVGALRFRDEDGVFQRASEEGRRTAPPLVELKQLLAASSAVERDRETAADLAYLRGRGTSLGGMRPKCVVVDDDGCLSIAKFPSVHDERAVTRGEVLALRLASRAGVNAAEATLVSSDGLPVALIRRFDRPRGGGRLLYASAATLLGANTREGDDYAYTDIVDTIRKHGGRVQQDVEQLWRRIAFTILVTNVDDHLHNHGFLHVADGQWRLSPAFDINPFPDRHRELKTWISADTGPEASIDALMGTAPYFRLSRATAKQILGDVEAAVATWREVGAELGMGEPDLERFADAFEHKERAAVQRLL